MPQQLFEVKDLLRDMWGTGDGVARGDVTAEPD